MKDIIFTSSSELPLVMTASDLSNALQLSRASAYNLLHSQKIKACRIGRRIFVTKDEFLRYIDEESKFEENHNTFR